MCYTLIHGDTEVADVRFDDTGFSPKIIKVHSIEHLPPGTVHKGVVSGTDLMGWWNNRSIPDNRVGLKEALLELDLDSKGILIQKCMGLSLSDHYWIRANDSDLRWSDVNLFQNSFSNDLGDMLIGIKSGQEYVDFTSPDSTTEGMLVKRWGTIKGKHYLFKGGSGRVCQEPFNEVVASCLMESQGVDHVHYGLEWIGEDPFSVCEDFVDSDTELVTASHLLKTLPRPNDRTVYDHYVKVCDSLGVDVIPSLDRMITIDYIMMDYDRHLNNFGLIRDAKDLRYLRPAPIYDTGTSLGCRVSSDQFPLGISESCKPFRKDFESQMGLVQSLDWFDADRMLETMPTIKEILGANDFLRKDRVDAIMRLLEGRVEKVRSRQRGRLRRRPRRTIHHPYNGR